MAVFELGQQVFTSCRVAAKPQPLPLPAPPLLAFFYRDPSDMCHNWFTNISSRVLVSSCVFFAAPPPPSVLRLFLLVQVQNTYRTLLSLYHKCLDNLRPGEPVKAIVDKAHQYLREKTPDLEQHITKVMGGELQNTPYMLKCVCVVGGRRGRDLSGRWKLCASPLLEKYALSHDVDA